jgi:hypothetical protein
MDKHGTAVINQGQFGELAGAVVGQLWSAIKDISPARAQHLIENQGELKRLLQRVFSESGTPSNLYTIAVDYGMKVEDAVKLGKYDWVNDDVTQKNFPTKGKGKTELTLELVHFDRNISSEEALKELDRMGYRPAELMELLAFGEKYPEIQREFPIVALASVWQGPRGSRSVPCLCRFGSGRGLDLIWIGDDWSGFWRFAAVRK